MISFFLKYQTPSQLLNKHTKMPGSKDASLSDTWLPQVVVGLCVKPAHRKQHSELAEAQPLPGEAQTWGSLLLQSGWPPIFYKVKFGFIPL